MHLAIIDVKEKAAVRFEQPVCLGKSGGDEFQEVVEDIYICASTQFDGLVLLTHKAFSIPFLCSNCADPGPGLGAAGVEWGIDINQIDG